VNVLQLALPTALLRSLQAMASQAHWKPGTATAGGAAAEVKRCDVAEVLGNPGYDVSWAEALAELYAFMRCERVRDFALPQNIFGLRLVSYGAGQSYGAHTDEALGVAGRADLSFTILLQEPVAGGALRVQGERVCDGAGHMVLYPSTTVHEVTEVREGQRLALVGWVQSWVRDAAKRKLLADLQFIVENDYDANRVRAVRNELLRLWS
jgi:PKHD-type hydroxylase